MRLWRSTPVSLRRHAYVSATAKVRQGTEDFDRTSIYGVSEAFYRADTQKTMQGSSLENGRFLRYIDVERHQNVCVIGSYLAENAFRTDPLGQTISVSGVPYMVVGVLAESGDSTEGSVDDVIYIPYANAQRLGRIWGHVSDDQYGPGYGVCCQGHH